MFNFKPSLILLNLMEVINKSSISTMQKDAFKTIVGEQFVFVDEENLHKYSHDETENLHYLPEVVIKPRSAEEISEIGNGKK